MDSITRRKFIRSAGGLGMALLGRNAAGRSAGPGRPPNLLFILTDDQRWDTLGCMGNPILETPNIDRLAADGVIFDNAFVTTSICPSNRASVFTGQHLRTHGVADFNVPLSDEKWSHGYPALLRKAGYYTGFVGKFGVGNYKYALEQFDFWRGLAGQGDYFQTLGDSKIHSSQWMAEQAVEFLAAAPPGRPWCLSISFKAPHHPRTEFDPQFSGFFKDVEMPLRPTARPEAESGQPEFIRDSLNGSRWWAMTAESLQEDVRNYYRMVRGIDQAVGKITTALDRLGHGPATTVFYTSDNGYLLLEHGLMGKWLMYEESIRVPFIVSGASVHSGLRGARRREMVLSIDCAPTLLSLAGARVPERMQGMDLSPLLRPGQPGWRDEWFYEHTYTEEHPRNIP
jgi:arylsulfatase A-like enzyme